MPPSSALSLPARNSPPGICTNRLPSFSFSVSWSLGMVMVTGAPWARRRSRGANSIRKLLRDNGLFLFKGIIIQSKKKSSGFF